MRSLKQVLGVLLAILAVQQTFAFSLLGPLEDWQKPELGYGRIHFQGLGVVDNTGSKNREEEFRLNTPIITYAFDPSFDYFGPAGVRAVDQAFAVINRLPRVSQTAPDLSGFLTEGNQRINHSAEALNLLDIKSTMLSLLLEHMGLMGETHVFDLFKRTSLPGQCNFSYQTTIRNFDPITWAPTPYVNGVLYTYEIQDSCPEPDQAGDAVERLMDSQATAFTAAATQAGIRPGGYFLNITRDDMGGLRYLYSWANVNSEILPDGATIRANSSAWGSVPVSGTNNVITNTLAERCGIEKVYFVKTRIDRTTGNYYQPLTNDYSVIIRTNQGNSYNYTYKEQKVRRIIRRPDILICAENMQNGFLLRSINFGTNVSSSANIAGPGTIEPQMRITMNKVGPTYNNRNPALLDELRSTPYFRWGSYDGSTNAPIAYPYGTSLQELEWQALSGN